MSNFAAGSVLGRYELLVPIARGGMAEVWAARLHGTRGFTKLVAIKMIREGSMDDTQLEQMFLYEAQLASQIQHPNVISTLELGEHEGSLFLAMEWADAEPVSFLLKEANDRQIPIPTQVGVNIVAQACRGLHCAHELRDHAGEVLGVVHRDVSPQNILVTYLGTVKLVDFGIAKATQRASSLTEDGQVRGKLAYMSPEQARGETLDRRSDIFAMGAVLYVLTTGQHPFKGGNPGETLGNLLAETPVVKPRQIDPHYPAGLEAVVMKCLEKSREQRFGTTEELLLALERAVPGARAIDSDVARFLAQLSGPRGEQRRQHIRAAGDILDKSTEELGPASQSPTSLSAVYLGRSTTHTMPSAAQDLDSDTARALRRKPTRGWAIGATAGLAGALLGVAAFTNPSSPPGPPPAASPAALGLAHPATDIPSTPVARPALTQPAPTPATPSKDTPAPDGTALAPEDQTKKANGANSNGANATTRNSTPQRPSPAKRPVARKLPAPTRAAERSPVPQPATTATNAHAQRPESPAAKSTPKVDAWDPDSFGGRL